MTVKRALITGVTGQTGSHLADYLLSLGYEVYGLCRRLSSPNTKLIAHLIFNDMFHRIYGDLSDSRSLISAMRTAQPDEVYNLAAQSFVPESWSQPFLTTDVTAVGVLRVLDALKEVCPQARFYQASSSEMFGQVRESPQCETTPFYPRSPYAAAKAYGHYITVNYRESYGLFACSGIAFNHEGPRRGLEFVTRKITDAAARISLGMLKELKLGNVDARRDWGHAADYVRAMHLILQQPKPDDYVIATGEMHSVRDFAEMAFNHVSLDYRDYVVADASLLRPAEVSVLRGDATKLHGLGWRPQIGFSELVRTMVDADMMRHKSSFGQS